MTKEEFFNLSDDRKRFLVSEALCNLILFEELAPSFSKSVIRSDNFEVMKIVLGAYMNGKIN